MRFGWDGARACQTDGIETTCYDTEAEMLAAIGVSATSAATPSGTSGLKRAACGSYLRLYTGTNYTGSVLALTTQFAVLNLSSYGFNNVTSSYRGRRVQLDVLRPVLRRCSRSTAVRRGPGPRPPR